MSLGRISDHKSGDHFDDPHKISILDTRRSTHIIALANAPVGD